MQRDKRGRFVRKAEGGLKLPQQLYLRNGKQYKLKPNVQINENQDSWLNLAVQDPDTYEQYLGTFYEPIVATNTTPIDEYRKQFEYNVTPSNLIKSDSNIYVSDFVPQTTQATIDAAPSIYDVEKERVAARQKEEEGLHNPVTILEEEKIDKTPSAGMNLKAPGKVKTAFSNIGSNIGNKGFNIDKNKLANFLDLAKAGIGMSVNNKIAQRALDAEKPLLQDVSERHRSVYGDYRAQVEGEKAAARLRNMASKPLTSDGALQQQMMMEAQIKGQDYIDQGNAKDEAMIRQTREVAWQQEQENQQQRAAVAAQNRQAMLMAQKNKAQIENARDSANYSQIIEPLLSSREQRLRNEGAKQQHYQDYYDSALVSSNVWNTYNTGLSPAQQALKNQFLSGGIEGVKTYIKNNSTDTLDLNQEWNQLQKIMNNEILRRQAALKGVIINPQVGLGGNTSTNNYGIFSQAASLFNKKGGTIYKARLTKRTKDNDRGAKSIESSKKIAARFLEKAIDSLYTYNDVELIARPKKKKRKYQAGGGLPFVGYTPVFATSETGAPKETASTKEDLTSKDVLQLLKDMDGLPSDMGIIIESLQNFELESRMDPLGLSASSDIASRYISLIGKIKMAKFNREEYNQAFNQLKGNGGLNELAITSEGMLVGMNKDGNFEYFTAQEANDGKASEKGYQLLTNSNLLYMRANSPEAAFNHKLTTVAQNGIGMETVTKMITDAIANLGSNKDSQEGYIKTKTGELVTGLQDFLEAMQASGGKFDGTISDLYKYKYLTKSQAEQAKKAMQYIYQTLPMNARALLKVKSNGSDSGAIQLIETLISSKETNESQIDVTLVGGKTHSKTTAEGRDGSDLKTSLPLNVQKSIGGVDSFVDVDRGDGIHMSVRGTQYNLLTTPSGEPIIDTSLAGMLNKTGLQGIVKDMRNIQFGDQVISPEALSYITYNNTGITRANLPIKQDGSVNLDLLEAYEKAERELELSSNRSKEYIKTVYDKYGLFDLLNADGSYNQAKFAPFMITEGYTTDALSGLKDSEFVKEYKGDDNTAIALMQRSLAVGTGKNVQVPEVDTFSWYNPADWFGWTDTIYKGVIYIPITNNVNSAVFGANQSLDYDEALSQEEKYQNFEKMSRQNSTNADILNI